jgi:nucleoside-diphosphate-sugar epimerase
VHLAAEIASQRSAAKLHEVNVRGTERLLEACRASATEPEAGPRIVFCSTVVTGDARGALLTEEQPLPVQTPYGRSKQEGERLLFESGLPGVVVRPSHVYGPGGWYANELVAQLRQPGRFAVVGRGENLWDVVHVSDVVRALMLAAESASPGSIYHVVDDEPITFYDFMALTAEALGLGRPRRLPVALARLVAGGNAVDAIVRSARSSNAKIKRELGWRPMFPSAREGVADSVASLAGS